VLASAVVKNHGTVIWSVADLLRGDCCQSEDGRVILAFTVLRRLDCVLDPTRDAVVKQFQALQARGIENADPVLQGVAGEQSFNTSTLPAATPPAATDERSPWLRSLQRHD